MTDIAGYQGFSNIMKSLADRMEKRGLMVPDENKPGSRRFLTRDEQLKWYEDHNMPSQYTELSDIIKDIDSGRNVLFITRDESRIDRLLHKLKTRINSKLSVKRTSNCASGIINKKQAFLILLDPEIRVDGMRFDRIAFQGTSPDEHPERLIKKLFSILLCREAAETKLDIVLDTKEFSGD